MIGSNKLLSSMLLYDNAGKDIRANMQNKSMLAARNKGKIIIFQYASGSIVHSNTC